VPVGLVRSGRYELVLVVSPEAGEEGFPVTVDRVHGLIKERGGEVKNVDRWGRRRLAYPVERYTEGYYSITQFTLDPQAVREIEGSLDLAEDVLRRQPRPGGGRPAAPRRANG